MVTRIPYHLAERKTFRIEIYRPDPNMPDDKERGKKIRTLDEGYTGKSPQGRYANTHQTRLGIPEPMDLNGTSVHWDGKDEMNNEVLPLSHDDPCHDYKAYLIVGEAPDEMCYGPTTITKAPPPPPKPSEREDHTVTDSCGDDNIILTLKGPISVTRSHMETYTASISGLTSHDRLTFNWTYTTNIEGG